VCIARDRHSYKKHGSLFYFVILKFKEFKGHWLSVEEENVKPELNWLTVGNIFL